MFSFLNKDSFLGDYVLVEGIEEGDKVKAEIVQILLKDNIKYIRSQNCW
jgi:probable RNA-binding protein EIF1AD